MASRSAVGVDVNVAAANAGADRSGRTGDESAVVSVDSVNRRFGQRQVLHDLSLEIALGEIVALIGRSGSGKSTLLRALAGLDRGVTGSIEVRGAIGVAFQDPRLLPWQRVLDNVCLGLRVPDAEMVAHTALEEVGLADLQGAWPLTLSGGEAQRVSLARALVRDPRLLLLDEPFGALDALTRISMHGLMLGLWERHRPAILLVTHDVDEALALADRIVVLADGRITYESRITRQRPRDRDDLELTTLRARLLEELGVDTRGGPNT